MLKCFELSEFVNVFVSDKFFPTRHLFLPQHLEPAEVDIGVGRDARTKVSLRSFALLKVTLGTSVKTFAKSWVITKN